MGYRSKIYLAVDQSDLLRFDNLLIEHDCKDVVYARFTSAQCKGYALFEADWIKWYVDFEGYEHITAMDNAFSAAEKEDLCFGAMRLGEGDGNYLDAETWGAAHLMDELTLPRQLKEVWE